MAGTRLTLVRQPVTFSTGTKYQVAAQCTDPGTLPSTSIFVFEIVQPEDPKNDAFLRLSEVTDFLTYGTSRETAIQNGTNIYRAASVTLNYDDVVTANGAWQELSSRINTLVTSYDTYMTAFLTPSSGASVLYPTVDESTKNALIAAYRSAVNAVTAAETARDTEQVACNAIQLELTTLQAQYSAVVADIASITPIVAAANQLVITYPPISSTITASKDSIRNTNNASAASAPDKASIEAQLQTIEAQLYAFASANADLTSDVQVPLAGFLGTLQTRAADLTQQVDAKQLEFNDCMLEMATLQGAVDQARQRRDAALAAVRAVCPDFNPATDNTDVGLLPGEIPLILGS